MIYIKYVETASTEPQYNLAVEEYIFNRISKSGENVFMLWQNEPTIVVGRFQNTLEEINADYAREKLINIVRRMSGGGAVYHDRGNLNYTFIVNRESNHEFNFKTYCTPIIEVLRKKGVNATFSSRNDLTIEGKKFSGNAQYMKKGVILHHGTLLFDSDLSVLSNVLNVAPDKYLSKGLKSIRSRVTNIKPHLSENMTVDEFKKFLLEEIQFEGQQIEKLELNHEDTVTIRDLADKKYSSWNWNYGASPEFTEKKERRFDFGKVEVLLNVVNGVIQNCTFYGDFFGNGELENLEETLKGIPYKKDKIKRALEHKNLGHYFNGADRDEFINFMCP